MTDTTQMMSGSDCPVCGAANPALSVWCGDCGFRLETTPGEAVEITSSGYILLGGPFPLPLKPGDNVVGRLQADVFLSDPSISRRHAVVVVSEDGVSVRDEGSSNGTKVNGAAIIAGEDVPVMPGQAVQFGTVSLRLSGADGLPVEADEEPAVEMTGAAGKLSGELGTFVLREGANSIGRRSGNDIVLNDPYVSGVHAVIVMDAGRATLADSGSSNGTFLGEERLEAGVQVELAPGQEICFGRQILRYELAVTDEKADGDAS